ncbi:MAG: formyltransferase family protein [Candidatus Promineifilaceae bacterium]
MDKPRPNLVVMLSGDGEMLQALIDAIEMELLEARIALVVSNRKAATGLSVAQDAGIETLYFPMKPFRKANRSRYEFDDELALTLKPFNPEIIVLLGWSHILSHTFLSHYVGRVINLRPALPSQFVKVENPIEDAYAAFRRMRISYSGCSVHLAIPEAEAGAPVVTAMVPMRPIDGYEEFERRMRRTEKRIIVLGVQIALEAVGG